MKQKQKRTANPFTAFLRPEEDLLWQSPENVDILASVIPRLSLSSVVSLSLFLMVMGGCGVMASSRPDMFVGVLGGLVGLVGMSLIVLRYIYRWIWHKQVFNMAIPDLARYAITSERLFYERGNDIQAEALENITLINILPNNTLSFGAALPQWSGLGDAEQVKLIIDQAQKERLKAIHSQEENLQDRSTDEYEAASSLSHNHQMLT